MDMSEPGTATITAESDSEIASAVNQDAHPSKKKKDHVANARLRTVRQTGCTSEPAQVNCSCNSPYWYGKEWPARTAAALAVVCWLSPAFPSL